MQVLVLWESMEELWEGLQLHLNPILLDAQHQKSTGREDRCWSNHKSNTAWWKCECDLQQQFSSNTHPASVVKPNQAPKHCLGTHGDRAWSRSEYSRSEVLSVLQFQQLVHKTDRRRWNPSCWGPAAHSFAQADKHSSPPLGTHTLGVSREERRHHGKRLGSADEVSRFLHPTVRWRGSDQKPTPGWRAQIVWMKKLPCEQSTAKIWKAYDSDGAKCSPPASGLGGCRCCSILPVGIPQRLAHHNNEEEEEGSSALSVCVCVCALAAASFGYSQEISQPNPSRIS